MVARKGFRDQILGLLPGAYNTGCSAKPDRVVTVTSGGKIVTYSRGTLDLSNASFLSVGRGSKLTAPGALPSIRVTGMLQDAVPIGTFTFSFSKALQSSGWTGSAGYLTSETLNGFGGSDCADAAPPALQAVNIFALFSGFMKSKATEMYCVEIAPTGSTKTDKRALTTLTGNVFNTPFNRLEIVQSDLFDEAIIISGNFVDIKASASILYSYQNAEGTLLQIRIDDGGNLENTFLSIGGRIESCIPT